MEHYEKKISFLGENTQRNETTGTCGQNRYQYAEPFQD